MDSTSIDVETITYRLEELTDIQSIVQHHFDEALRERDILIQLPLRAEGASTKQSIQSQVNHIDERLEELEMLIHSLGTEIVQVKNVIAQNIHEQLIMEKLTKMQAEEHGRWSVCLEDYEENEFVEITPCNHIFHSDCLLSWLDDDNITCPLCRANLGR